MKETAFLPFVFAGVAAVAFACGGSQQTTESPSGTTGSGPDEAATAAATTGGGESSGGATGSGGSSGSGGSEPSTPAGLVAVADAARGEKLYGENHCDGCHGTKAKPPKKFPNVFKVKWDDAKEIDEAFAIIKKGKSPMPGFGDKLDDEAIADLVAFMKAPK